jgi:hypothetical protein
MDISINPCLHISMLAYIKKAPLRGLFDKWVFFFAVFLAKMPRKCFLKRNNGMT